MNDIFGMLAEKEIETRADVSLSTFSTFKIGGRADVVAYPTSAEALCEALRVAKKLDMTFEIIGNCSNILFSDDGYRGLIVSTEKLCELSFKENRVTTGVGVSLPLLSKRAAELGLSGLEFACGIPAYIGGAVYMNAGAHGGEMADVVLSTRAYDCDKDIVFDIYGEDNRFSYRHSIYSESSSLVCLSAELCLRSGERDEIKARMRDYTEKRRSTQPIDMPSAGSFFKRPDGYFAAKLIDDCGLKGARVGNAAVSEKHAGFIVNLGGATANEVLELSKLVSDKVFDQTGIRLSREVRYIGG